MNETLGRLEVEAVVLMRLRRKARGTQGGQQHHRASVPTPLRSPAPLASRSAGKSLITGLRGGELRARLSSAGRRGAARGGSEAMPLDLAVGPAVLGSVDNRPLQLDAPPLAGVLGAPPPLPPPVPSPATDRPAPVPSGRPVLPPPVLSARAGSAAARTALAPDKAASAVYGDAEDSDDLENESAEERDERDAELLRSVLAGKRA